MSTKFQAQWGDPLLHVVQTKWPGELFQMIGWWYFIFDISSDICLKTTLIIIFHVMIIIAFDTILIATQMVTTMTIPGSESQFTFKGLMHRLAMH